MSFKNSEEDRKLLEESVPEPFLSSILCVWQNALISLAKSLKLIDNTPKNSVRESVSIAHLDGNSALIFKTKHIYIDDVEYGLGAQDELLFENSKEGRKVLFEAIPGPFVSVVMAVWGDSPIVESPKKLTELEEIELKKVALNNKFCEI